MFYKKPLLFFLFVFISLEAFPAVFTVTSNADSGPGTLRDALTQAAANGNSAIDYINFNLPDTTHAGRTIILKSNLPSINSDMVIDGSTQPGPALSVNGAKVIIGGNYMAGNYYINYFLIENVNYVEIDGLIIKSFLPPPFSIYYGVQPIIISGTNQTIKFGEPGKGNVFYDCSQAIECTVGEGYYFPTKSFTDSIIMKNNYVGVKEDGKTTTTNGQSKLQLNYVANAILGGDTKAEGNLFYSLVSFSPSYGTDNFKQNTNYYIRNNIFGANLLQQATPGFNPNYLALGVDPNNVYTNSTAILIADNVFAYGVNINGFQLLNLQMQHNFFGVSSDKKNNLPIKDAAISLSYMQGTILIGGIDTTRGNIFANCTQSYKPEAGWPGVVNVTDFSVTIDPLFKVELSHNSFYCNNSPPFLYDVQPGNKPLTVSVDNLTSNSVSGTTQPNARVELFYTDKECTQCQPKTYLTTAYAGSDGKWTYHANLLGGYGVMAGATLNHVSSEFTDTRIYYKGAFPVVTYSECGMGGSITGFYTVNAKSVEWLDSANNVVGKNNDLLNVPAGRYVLRADQFGCITYSDTIYMFDTTPHIYDQGIKIVNPSCGNGGSITNLYVKASDQYAWIDAQGNTISNQLDLTDVSAGTYTLQVTGQRGCIKTYGPVTLKKVTGPNIDQSKVAIQSTNCGQSTGSITNLAVTGTGTLKYIWWNGQQQTASTVQDLLNQPAGTYKLEVTDDSQCGPVYTADLTIPETNGIVMDESKAQTTVASCSNNNGSVSGITVTGATQYQWLDANNQVVGTGADLQNVAPGTYIMASNSFGCTATSKAYAVGQLPPTKFPVYAATATPACFQQTDGSVTVSVDALVKSVRWVNASGQDAGTSGALTNLGAGTYQLYLTDQNGCENYYNTYTVAELPEYQVVSGGTVTNDQCNLGTGSISAADIEGGLPPYTYTWYNSSNQHIGTGPTISNLTAGTYTLNVMSARCGESNTLYTVANETADIAAPSVSNVQLCSSGNAIITVNNPSSSTVYRLYANPTDTQPLAEQKGGRFMVSVIGNTSFYISQLNGTCESARAEVKVSVGLSALNIANTFTPNGDGINDFWVINGIANYPAAEVQVFTRNGQRIFESKGYVTPFDGTFDGKNLPEGVYYYIIDLHSNCSLLSGSLTIIR
jgi:gliding motility-associated-like protein